MSVRLVILGLLSDRPLHGYEIKQIIEEHMGDWTSIAFGSIYFALDKMSKNGFIEKLATEQSGNRPSRSVYQITAAGRDEFMRLLRKSWQNMERTYYAIDISLFFLDRLAPEEVKGYLQNRISTLGKIINHLQAHESEQLQNAEEKETALAKVIFDHTRVHILAELEWTKNILSRIDDGSSRL
jgi:DNA-binding PadR family transcriptional regulator